MKTILITGANRGIGYEVARQLLDIGHRVILSGRDKSRVAKAAGELGASKGSLETLIMDAGDSESISRAAATFGEMRMKLDVLVNNAGIVLKADKNLLLDPDQGILDTLHINSMGPLRIAKAFLPFLNTPGRIINISSGGGSMTDPVGGWSPAYCISKSLLNAVTRHLAYELEEKDIAVNAVCPGWVRTEMGGRSAPRSVEHGAETIVWMATTGSLSTGKFFRDKKVIPW